MRQVQLRNLADGHVVSPEDGGDARVSVRDVFGSQDDSVWTDEVRGDRKDSLWA